MNERSARLRRTAVHESAHAVAALETGLRFDRVIVNSGGGGRLEWDQSLARLAWSGDPAYAWINRSMQLVCLASRFGEEIVYGATAETDGWRWKVDVDIAIALARCDYRGDTWFDETQALVAEAEQIVRARLTRIEALADVLSVRHELPWAEARDVAGYSLR